MEEKIELSVVVFFNLITVFLENTVIRFFIYYTNEKYLILFL